MTYRDETGTALARALGWFSIGLGAVELLAPRTLASAFGMGGRERLLQAYGVREVASGMAILAAQDPLPWVWGRVAGDALDLATLAPTLDESNSQRQAAAIAVGAVTAVLLVDLLCTRELRRERDRPPPRDYSDRSGFPQGVERARGIAARQPMSAAGG